MRIFIWAIVSMAASMSFAQSGAALAHYQNGVVYWMSGQNDSARAELEAALRLAPEHYESHVALGEVLLHEGAYDRGRKHFARAQALRPQAAKPCLGMGHVLWEAEQNYPAALQEYRAALALEPENAVANYFVGQALLYDDRLEEAAKCLEQALVHDPSYAKPHEKLALVHMLRGERERAAQHWRECKRKGGMSQALVEFNQNVLLTVAHDGILFTNGEEDTYPLWYLQLSEGVRRDVSVVNVALLNFAWYVRMLRAHEPKLALRYAEENLRERLQERYWPKPNQVEIAGLRWRLAPVAGYESLRVQEVVMLDLLEWNAWQRPVYFAVTLAPENKLGLEDFLTMEGLAWRLHSKKAEAVQVDSAWANARKRYSYVYGAEPSDAAARRLSANYATMFCVLADAYLQKRERESCHAVLAWAESLGVLQDVRANEWAAKIAGNIGSEELAARFKRKAEALRNR